VIASDTCKLGTNLFNKRTTESSPGLFFLFKKSRANAKPATDSTTRLRPPHLLRPPFASTGRSGGGPIDRRTYAMVLPLVKLGLLAFRTLSKPIANRLKRHAGIHPKFQGFIVGVAQVTLPPPSLPPPMDSSVRIRSPFAMFGSPCCAYVRRGSPGRFLLLSALHRLGLLDIVPIQYDSGIRRFFRACWASLFMI
jgi:hypothetical protein